MRIRPSRDKAELDALLALGRTAVKVDAGHGLEPAGPRHRGIPQRQRGRRRQDPARRRGGQQSVPQAIEAGISAFYRAMSLFELGKPEEARALASAAAAKMKPLPADEQNPLAGGANADDLILWLAYKEAKAMIQFDAAPAAGAPRDAK